MWVAARCTVIESPAMKVELLGTRTFTNDYKINNVIMIECLPVPKLEQNLDMKSPVVIKSTFVSKAFSINLKHRPISFLLILLTAQISYRTKQVIQSCNYCSYRCTYDYGTYKKPYFKCSRNTFLPAGDIQARGCNSIVSSTFQISSVVYLLEQQVRTIDYRFR